MKRPQFLGKCAAAAISLSGSSDVVAADTAAHGASGRKLTMRVGCQNGPTTPKMLDYFKRHGVEHICGYPAIEAVPHVGVSTT